MGIPARMDTYKGFDTLHDIRDLEAILGCRKTKIYELFKRGDLRPVKVGASTKVFRSEIERFLSSQKAAVFRKAA